MGAKGKQKESPSFKLTYATMFNPPAELHTRYEEALRELKENLGRDHAMIIGGKEVFADEKLENRSPIHTDWLLGTFQKGTAQHAEEALAAARAATHVWGKMPWQERVALMKKAADEIDRRIYQFGAVISLEVGKNRMEALGDAAEAADLIRYACSQMEANNGFIKEMGKDPLEGYDATNTDKLLPHGVWMVISPFNFPAALTGGPSGAALVAGNTLVMKPASDTPWTTRLLAECFRAAGLPDGAFNYVTGPGSTLGEALINSPEVDGITFTGSYDVGMHIYRQFAQGIYPRPIILEMGGKNASIVTKQADLDRATAGIVRSAFGLQGQKCSANSRIYVEKAVYDDLVNRILESIRALTIGDPTDRKVFMGPVINASSYEQFQQFSKELSDAGKILTGGKVLTDGDFAKGYYCQPTIAAEVPTDHRLWKHEMFLPITMIHAVDSKEQAMELTNDSIYGLTAGFYGSEDEAQWFFENIKAGVTYANRPQGSTTGAWPGFQPFGGWKASGLTGKNAGGYYYLQGFMREQVNTLIR
jgi:1-pyrroline-5-carboxylate dehydrogenase